MPARAQALRGGATALALTLAFGMAGCGQKGALYLPDRGGEVITRPMQTPAEQPAPEATSTPAATPAAGEDPAPGASPAKPSSEPPR